MNGAASITPVGPSCAHRRAVRASERYVDRRGARGANTGIRTQAGGLRTAGQRDVIERILSMLAEKGAVITEHTRGLLEQNPPAAPVEIVRHNPMLAVARHYADLMPAWAAGIALDLMPLAILCLSIIAVSDERAKQNQAPPLADFTAADLMASAQVFAEIFETMGGIKREPETGPAQTVADWIANINGIPNRRDLGVNGHGSQPEVDFTWTTDSQ